ncbi:uncharacterized protein FIBRA_01958 [Fibroporia radiculosa]|uniref:DNA helicase n=1 Tax=Fibroporia radiculosa TaxID=599839 RepID=J4G199_9APHY|nr:uncharacterized protein FIBRA_01958 [Fibroporia radiculosa]CCL99933.1 predicted protein [Fibroporia radiculosa]
MSTSSAPTSATRFATPKRDWRATTDPCPRRANLSIHPRFTTKMPPYDDWNKVDEDDEDELQDNTYLDGRRDVILFCIDCSPSMLELHDDPKYENLQTCHLYTALEAAMEIEKKKVLIGPNDAVGIMLFNTVGLVAFLNEPGGQSAEIKRGTYVHQPINTINAPSVQELIRLLEAAREDPNHLREAFPPLTETRVPMGDVFTSCNWVIRDGAPKTATKRIFLITDEDDPHPGPARERLITSARTTHIDLGQAGVIVEPFFISTEEKEFRPAKFYSSVLLPHNLVDDGDAAATVLPESISITRIDDLLQQMRFHEVPKRALFSLPLQLAPGLTIGVKGYGLVTEQRRGAYKYFVDLGDRMEVATSRTVYVDEDRQAETERTRVLYGLQLGATVAAEEAEVASDDEGGTSARVVSLNSRVFYTADEVRSFRNMGLDPGIKLLGFKDRSELAFEDNVKHSLFIYPDEMSYSGSKRTFSALLRTMIRKKKIALVLSLARRNSSPVFCAMLPQQCHAAELWIARDEMRTISYRKHPQKVDESGWREPPGFHLIPLPFADDIRAASVDESIRALSYHNVQLQASAFREEFDPASFEDLTVPKYDMIHKVGWSDFSSDQKQTLNRPLLKAWKEILLQDEAANSVIVTTGSKRKADISVDEAEIRSKHEVGMLAKLRLDQLKASLAGVLRVDQSGIIPPITDTKYVVRRGSISQEFLKSKSEPVSGRKAELVERVSEWLDKHP